MIHKGLGFCLIDELSDRLHILQLLELQFGVKFKGVFSRLMLTQSNFRFSYLEWIKIPSSHLLDMAR